jgi:hypothetical protein
MARLAVDLLRLMKWSYVCKASTQIRQYEYFVNARVRLRPSRYANSIEIEMLSTIQFLVAGAPH